MVEDGDDTGSEDLDDTADIDDTDGDDHDVTVRRAPQNEPSVETPKSHPITCRGADGFRTSSAAKRFCRTGIRGAGTLVSTKVTRSSSGFAVRCCHQE